MSGTYIIPLVLLSIAIAVVSAYAAIELAGRILMARGRARLVWLLGGAISMGIGIWAMHYVGMVAYQLPVPIFYHLPTVLLSLFIAVLASFVGLLMVTAVRHTVTRTLLGGTSMGAGIAAMHYVGMAAMRLRGVCHYSPYLVALSIVAAIVISCLAMEMIFALRSVLGSWNLRKAGGALLLGLAIPVMHYIGMASVRFTPASLELAGVNGLVTNSIFDRVTLISVVLSVLAIAIISAVVDRRLATQASELALSRQQLLDVFDNMDDAFVVLDIATDAIRSNRAAMELLNIPEMTFAGEAATSTFRLYDRFKRLVSFEDLPLTKAKRHIFVDHEEYTVVRLDNGCETTCEVSARAVRGADGSTRQFFVNFRDITDRKQHTDTRARLAAIVDSSQDAIISKDERGLVRSWNAAAERIFGYTSEEMIGQSILRLIPSELQQEEFDFLRRLRRGEMIDHVETVRRHKSGRPIYVSLTISPVHDAHGRFVGSSKIARDISERKMLERQLARTHKMQAIGELTGGIAHDFNNLLGVIVGNMSLLESMAAEGVAEPNEEIFNRMRIVQRAASRGADLTRRLLTFSSTGDLNPVSTEVSVVVNDAIELAARTLGPEVRVSSRVADGLPAIFVDPSGLESALLNLMVNARDAMPKGGSISILAEPVEFDDSSVPVRAGELRPGPYVALSVTDTGEGMSAQTLERALEPFFTTKARGKGTGLGLPMVYGFARQSGGAVRIYSELGHGTTVTLYVKLATAAPLPKLADQQPLVLTDPDLKVLVVDDEPELLEIAVSYLRRMGVHHTLEARSGAEAMALLRTHPDVALLITDVIMPGGINGAELVEHARQSIPAIKVIYSSGFPADALADRSGTAVDGHLLRKPYQRTDFENAVRIVLEQSTPRYEEHAFAAAGSTV